MKPPSSPQDPSGELYFDLSGDDQALFLAEIDEILQRFEEALVDLESAPDSEELLQEIFRSAHTIKGNSSTIGHTRMAALTHAMETRLDDVRKGVAPVTPELIEALLKAVDVLKLLRDEVETHRAADVDVEAYAAAVERRAGLRDPLPAEATKKKSGRKTTAAAATATHRITVALEASKWTAVRALQVLLALGEIGKVISSDPPQSEIETEDAQIGDVIVVDLLTVQPESALHEALNRVPELGSVVVETLPAPVVTESQANDAGRSAGPVEKGATSATPASSKTIRIDVARLDALLNLVGELVIDRTRLVQLGNNVAERFGDHRVIGDLQQTALHIGRITDELQEQVMKSRMLPIESVFSRLPRVVRDISAKQGKQVDFIIEGKDTELDRSVIEEIGDPLLHLIRNSVDHGLEPPEERIAAGKAPVGKLRLSAHHADSHIVITLDDDGRGLPLDALKRKAAERGAITSEQADRMTDAEAVQLIFEAGLSTAKELSDVSGRGVGMDIVRANVEKINGSVEVSTRRGGGTTFTIRLPLTLAIIQALLVRVAGGIYALPIHAVTETLRVEPDQIHRINRRDAMQLRGTVLPLVALRRVFGIHDSESPDIGTSARLVVAVHAPGGRQIGLIVDGLIGEQEIVIKPLGNLVGDVPGVSGAAILGDGSVALIMDVSSLINQSVRDGTTVGDAESPGQKKNRSSHAHRPTAA
ncbi:MAG TPA: chemotaxis protein CheA [Chloroflexota bacterium]|nr:chemotaxis protein CheA [Chloroflexota bacterium]